MRKLGKKIFASCLLMVVGLLVACGGGSGLPTKGKYNLTRASIRQVYKNAQNQWVFGVQGTTQPIAATGSIEFDGDKFSLTINGDKKDYTHQKASGDFKNSDDFFKTGLDPRVFHYEGLFGEHVVTITGYILMSKDFDPETEELEDSITVVFPNSNNIDYDTYSFLKKLAVG